MESSEIKRQFEAHIREYEMLLHKVCRMYAYTDADHEDLFQDIIVQLWQAYTRFKGESKFSTWLYRVAINTAISQKRKEKDLVTSYDPTNLPAHHIEEESRKAEEELQFQQLYKAIAQLNQVEKAIIMLYMEERSYEEMEEIMGISEGTLRVKMNRIKEKLRTLTKTIQHGT